MENKELYKVVITRKMIGGRDSVEWDAELSCDKEDEVINVIRELNDQIRRCFSAIEEANYS